MSHYRDYIPTCQVFDGNLVNLWHVYIVRCVDGSLYTGVTTDPERRVDEHNRGGRVGAKYTRARRPVSLVYIESHETRAAACRREWEIKQLEKIEKECLIGAHRL